MAFGRGAQQPCFSQVRFICYDSIGILHMYTCCGVYKPHRSRLRMMDGKGKASELICMTTRSIPDWEVFGRGRLRLLLDTMQKHSVKTLWALYSVAHSEVSISNGCFRSANRPWITYCNMAIPFPSSLSCLHQHYLISTCSWYSSVFYPYSSVSALQSIVYIVTASHRSYWGRQCRFYPQNLIPPLQHYFTRSVDGV